jgi:hypothetical protein
MADSPIDPSRLEGEDLRRWYLRSPAEIEQDRQDAAAQRYQDFFSGNDDVGSDPLAGDGLPSADPESDPVSSTDSVSATHDVDPGFTWVSDGPNRFRRVPISSDQGGRALGSRPAGQATQPANSAARPKLAPVSTSALQPRRSMPATPPSGPAPKPASPQAVANSPGFQSSFDMARDALHNFQNGPKIPRPNVAESFIPVVGPAWEATADLQDRNYAGAAFNGVMAVADALPLGVAVKGINAARKGVTVFKDGSLTARAAASRLRDWGIARKGEEIHHTAALNGTPRDVESWKNHYALLKVLPKDIHRRLTGSWLGKPEFDPIRKIWYGTTDWQKAIPTGLAGYAADSWEYLTHPFGSPAGSSSIPGRKP